MVAETDGARRWARWAAERHQPGLRGLLGNTAVILAAAGLAVGVLYVADVISARSCRAGGDHDRRHGCRNRGCRRQCGALGACRAGRPGRHFEPGARCLARRPADPRPRTAGSRTPIPLSTISSRNRANRRWRASPPRSPTPKSIADFERLRSRAAAGARAIAALPLRDSRGRAAGWFNIAVNPIAGRPGYSFWNLQDITARHEMEAVIRDERNKLVDFIDDAPIGFYSVDGAGRFLFVNRTLAKLLGGTPAGDRRQRGATARFPRPAAAGRDPRPATRSAAAATAGSAARSF